MGFENSLKGLLPASITTMMVLMQGECKLDIPQMQLAAFSLYPGCSSVWDFLPHIILLWDTCSPLESLLEPLREVCPATPTPPLFSSLGLWELITNCPRGKALGFKWYLYP